MDIRNMFLILKEREVSDDEDLRLLHQSAKTFGENLTIAISGLPPTDAVRFNEHRPKVHDLLHFR